MLTSIIPKPIQFFTRTSKGKEKGRSLINDKDIARIEKAMMKNWEFSLYMPYWLKYKHYTFPQYSPSHRITKLELPA